ncbi:SET and MYND domain-containing protein 4-like Protein [Tribolium castaneum]|uniref:Protein-lysine N-methyltransferase SMYD4 n=1 Tax=Tribolium castaneum TaxID=7070 RepID=D6WW76_TRICA|nr:PREDICTED: SET and MYND domain-containing protein 4 [Tribolium castaneum]EFA09316.2 SET and MYND domain-containing protein 4-like Protein [Tribolium castaneum]|eukprot:XP_971167.2 PREDICTED: SET and MYND domain-containing protein 4 [Tribolium castaneum]
MFSDEKYLEICSEKTLQVDKEGFFLQFAKTVAENVGEKWVKNIFGKLKTDSQRIRIIYKDDEIKDYIIGFLSNVQEIYRKKSPEIALNRFSEAEKCGDSQKALNLYNQAILKSPESDPTLPLALIRRANLLVTLNEFSHALTDTQLALKLKVPNDLKFSVFATMAQCYKALNDETKAQISQNLAENLTNDPKLIEKLRQTMAGEYAPIERVEKVIPPISERHADFSHASSKITLKTSPDVGRYVVSNVDIATGEILVAEPAAVACLNPEKFGTHCQHCFARLLAPVGCPHCSSVAFCSPKCRDDAITTYHKYECKFFDLLLGSGMSVLSLMALRIITQQSLTQTLEIYDKKNTNALYNLCTNESKRQNSDFLQRSLMAAFLLRCLQKSGYFGENGTVVPTQTEHKVGEMLLHYLQILQFNAHEIYETLYSEDHSLKSAKMINIGVAVYPTVALFNHECYPSVTRYFVGKTIVIASIRPLTPNTPISENYGPIFTRIKLAERQRTLLGRYWFNCQCQACLEDWPLLTNESNYVKRLKCPMVKCSNLFPLSPEIEKCPKCQTKILLKELIEKLDWCENQFKIGIDFVKSGKREEAIPVLRQALDTFHRVSAPPNGETHRAQEALRMCLADQGNTFDCLV